MGALTGAISGGIAAGAGSVASGLSPGWAATAKVGSGALAGGVSNWAQAAAAGHGSWSAFAQGAALGAIVSAASIGVQYLTSGSAATSAGTVNHEASPEMQHYFNSAYANTSTDISESQWSHIFSGYSQYMAYGSESNPVDVTNAWGMSFQGALGVPYNFTRSLPGLTPDFSTLGAGPETYPHLFHTDERESPSMMS